VWKCKKRTTKIKPGSTRKKKKKCPKASRGEITASKKVGGGNYGSQGRDQEKAVKELSNKKTEGKVLNRAGSQLISLSPEGDPTKGKITGESMIGIELKMKMAKKKESTMKPREWEIPRLSRKNDGPDSEPLGRGKRRTILRVV